MKTVLVVGASGVTGSAAAGIFADAGWQVITWSRRRPPEAQLCSGHISTDLRDSRACGAAIATLPKIDFVVYAALYEKPDLVDGWRDSGQMRMNLAMLQNVLEPLRRRSPAVHLVLFQGTKAYGSHLHDIPIPAKERQPRDQHENSYWLQEDYLRELASTSALAFTILRPQLVIGGAVGVAMNPIAPIGVYVELCKELGLSPGFPGGPEFIWEVADTRLLGSALLWTATHRDRAAGQTYNVTNGDVFTWRSLWPGLLATMGAEPAPDEPRELRSFFDEHQGVWRTIAERHGLRQSSLTDLLGTAAQAIDYYFASGQPGARHKLVSTVKIRAAGFTDVLDTQDAFGFWLGDLRERRYLPAV